MRVLTMAISPITTNQKQHEMRTEFLNGGNIRIQSAIESLMAASWICDELQNKLRSNDYGEYADEWRTMLACLREVAADCERRAMQLEAMRATQRQRLALRTMISDYQSAEAKP